jgi:hypothetical protein
VARAIAWLIALGTGSDLEFWMFRVVQNVEAFVTNINFRLCQFLLLLKKLILNSVA